MSGGSALRAMVVGVLLLGSVLGAGCTAIGSPQPGGGQQPGPTGATPAAASSQEPTPGAGGGAAAALGPDWVRVVAERVRPAVAQITNEQLAIDQFNQVIPAPAGSGSGVIFHARQGHILTNYHVVAGARQLTVALPDGRTFEGKLLGADADTDLAVVQITGDNLPEAALGDSTKLHVGDALVAIGNALALPGGPTVTAGVVSALGRAVQEPPDESGQPGPYLYGLIQTDAPINPGNSGGPLINSAGEVVGINTLVAGQAGPGVPAQGIGFAIATHSAQPIGEQLIATGRVVHPFIGIIYQPLNPSIAARLGLPTKQGVLITTVVAGSPAAKAGLRARDVITAIDGKALTDESTLGEVISEHKPGETVRLDAVRNGQQLSVEVTLGEKPSR